MSKLERRIYSGFFSYALNQALLPVKLVVPQPLIARFPLLTTNLDIRMKIVGSLLKGRALDVGCGENVLIQAYRDRGGDGVGVDVYPWKGVDLLVTDTSKLDFPDASFDTVTFVSCLNHIPNRIEVLREARRVLRPSGHVVLTNLTPVISLIWHRWAFWDEDQHERGMKDGEVWGFTPKELLAITKEGGFDLVSSHPFSWGLNRVYIFKPTSN